MPMISMEGRAVLHRLWVGSGLIDRLIHGPGTLWRRYSIRRARQATIQVLRSLDDRALKDIGMRRSEIESVVHDDKAERLLR